MGDGRWEIGDGGEEMGERSGRWAKVGDRPFDKLTAGRRWAVGGRRDFGGFSRVAQRRGCCRALRCQSLRRLVKKARQVAVNKAVTSLRPGHQGGQECPRPGYQSGQECPRLGHQGGQE